MACAPHIRQGPDPTAPKASPGGGQAGGMSYLLWGTVTVTSWVVTFPLLSVAVIVIV